ncbi:hypothetical protein HDV01_002870 [Terramyces sp. JEL0728]|nr:hypothetical protein HDV01_002870 [Terramyces sp. JEL0728]
MTLHLNKNLHDFALLVLPDDSNFNYTNLLSLCTDISGKQTIGLNLWSELASSHFKFTAQDARIFYETFSLSFSQQKGSMMSVPVLKFVLFLYNQLYGVSINQIPVKGQDEYPNIKEEPHFPLENSVLSSQVHSMSLNEIDVETIDHQPFPSHLSEGRNKLTTYWRSTTKKWLQLIYVVIYKRQADTKHNSKKQNGFDFSIKDLSGLDAFFTAIVPTTKSHAFKVNHERFQSWMNQREFDITFKFQTDVQSITADNKLQKVDVCTLLKDYFQYSNFSNGKAPLEALHYCFQWSIMENPPFYSTVKLSENGIPLGLEANKEIYPGADAESINNCGFHRIIFGPHEAGQYPSLLLAPFDKWYPGMLDNIKSAKHDLAINRWNLPVSMQKECKDVSLLPPAQFYLTELPFNFKEPKLKISVSCEGKKGKPIEYQTILKHLPMPYSAWLKGMSKITDLLIEAVKNATVLDPSLSTRVEDEFQKWLTTSGNIKLVGSMLGLQGDLEKLAK